MPAPIPEWKRIKIIELMGARKSNEQIVATFYRLGDPVSISTVKRITRTYKQTGSIKPGKSSGRPRVTTEDQDMKIIEAATVDNQASVKKIINMVNEENPEEPLRASRITVNMRLLEAKLHSRIPLRKEHLTETNIEERLRHSAEMLEVPRAVFW